MYNSSYTIKYYSPLTRSIPTFTDRICSSPFSRSRTRTDTSPNSIPTSQSVTKSASECARGEVVEWESVRGWSVIYKSVSWSCQSGAFNSCNGNWNFRI